MAALLQVAGEANQADMVHAARTPGAKLGAIEDAPGGYVKVKS